MYESQYKYEKTEKGKVAHRKYYLAHKEEKLEWSKKYRKTDKGKAANRKAMLQQYQRNKKTLEELKSNGCAICGYSECVAALDFHHVNSKNKNFNLDVASMCRKNKSVVEELNKCILLCANCHRKIHYEELD